MCIRQYLQSRKQCRIITECKVNARILRADQLQGIYRMSRNGNIGPQKLDARIDIPVSEELADKLTVLAHFMKKPKAQVARELLTIQMEGMLALMSVNISFPEMGVDGSNVG